MPRVDGARARTLGLLERRDDVEDLVIPGREHDRPAVSRLRRAEVVKSARAQGALETYSLSQLFASRPSIAESEGHGAQRSARGSEGRPSQQTKAQGLDARVDGAKAGDGEQQEVEQLHGERLLEDRGRGAGRLGRPAGELVSWAERLDLQTCISTRPMHPHRSSWTRLPLPRAGPPAHLNQHDSDATTAPRPSTRPNGHGQTAPPGDAVSAGPALSCAAPRLSD